MILIYAYGSGLGHLKRVSDFVYYQRIDPKKCIILTNSSYNQFWEDSWKIFYREDSLFKNKEKFRILTQQIVDEYLIDEFIVDVFPLGFYGELAHFISGFNGKKTLLARILSNTYFQTYPNHITYDTVYLLENGVEHCNYLGKEKIKLQLPYQLNDHKINYPLFNYFLIIHSQPESEIDTLYKTALMYRTSQKIIIMSMVITENKYHQKDIIILNQKQVNTELIENAEIIFSALGFNSYRLLSRWKEKWKPIPFPRKYDNQFLRKQLNGL